MRDTTSQAAEVQAGVQERLGGAGRLRLAYELSAAARALTLVGLQARRPISAGEQLSRVLHLPSGAVPPPGFPPTQ